MEDKLLRGRGGGRDGGVGGGGGGRGGGGGGGGGGEGGVSRKEGEAYTADASREKGSNVEVPGVIQTTLFLWCVRIVLGGNYGSTE